MRLSKDVDFDRSNFEHFKGALAARVNENDSKWRILRADELTKIQPIFSADRTASNEVCLAILWDYGCEIEDSDWADENFTFGDLHRLALKNQSLPVAD
ncbi:hypothetical protein KC722_00820 [Candidatus Kaiserbacteria bacterium]|nr:hypothetical protein [Candidatus Kaiserbacteria bacterium]MCB9811362.1 hypothetical protein [Candidatus Nomurabacteria bacterium]